MVRRLQPEQRRAEIIRLTREMIATGAAHELTLRSIARYCGMSAPGLMHHFPTVKELLETVLRQRDDDDMTAIRSTLVRDYERPTLLDLADTVVRYYAARPTETRSFDALEARAVVPEHPAHEFFASYRAVQPLEFTKQLAAQDYRDPESVLRVLGVVADGLRAQWLRETETPNYWDDWSAVRDHSLGHFERRA
ncbi:MULTISPECIES: TetR/AcrR family transcriptional regulator [unclassified Mycolicibacterium]|uniref:TetR/AcrR family transcriptional regulator n=1 Tax=unclassified Mycolicibacterium TaxID=2636767 RepID=UPI0012DF510B|nr:MULTISPECIES: TetR/AcrR family transcriptional regulator [unclassified Mycolicibacterium]MUL80849.1 TetR/AcrR family transcriptional regulator [Mycolicibacterium sp. CBMA 329]MUL86615.1 TetR/AcrR family transcriptional regulator [Mycolicibacterium sp. CBMA 331]MUM02819.1 TetR/AcrR family transcriptional regulator [Mycolicibacterium sp. CBMA 334]MUM26311.1 TetR/AcrR family transcriptional regulator [Mycolicibacterium sp. CBMA 295]MUM36912.1 TetR/AcrR family transcriptional regulator [Mycolic